MIRPVALALAALVAAFLLEGWGGLTAHALTIRDDQGGRIDFYLARAAALRHSHDTVRLDGPCNSACTLLVASVPRARVCVTDRASLGFHRAFEFDRSGIPVDSPRWTGAMTRHYSPAFKAWIRKQGGLTHEIKSLHGPELRSLYRPC